MDSVEKDELPLANPIITLSNLIHLIPKGMQWFLS